MPTNTYVALDKVTVSGSAVTDITFSNINQGYTDLVIVMSGFGAVLDGYSVLAQVGNGSVDTSANYSTIRLSGDGSSATSGRSSNANYMRLQSVTGQSTTSSNITNLIINFMNYSNTTTFKTVLNRANQPAGSYPGTEAIVNLWRSTSAINTIKLFPFTGASFAVGSTFSLYGIRAEGVSPTTKATGGAVYSDDVYYYHVFGSSGTFTPTQSITADVLVVAGGGGAGSRAGGGGGAGGLLAFTSQSLSATGYTCTVGSGGAGGGGTTTGGIGSNGTDSQFGGLTLVKGGGYGLRWLSAQSLGAAGTGGSGGGATMTANGTTSSAGSATSGQGNVGGGQGDNGAGGGGAGGPGGVGTPNGGAGGVGSSTYSSWGIATGVGQNVSGTYYLAGGGGGGCASNTSTGGAGGSGGGGNGNNATTTNIPTGNGQANTGGGGGGAGNNGDSSSVYGGNGGSGVIIVRYAK